MEKHKCKHVLIFLYWYYYLGDKLISVSGVHHASPPGFVHFLCDIYICIYQGFYINFTAAVALLLLWIKKHNVRLAFLTFLIMTLHDFFPVESPW